MNSNSQAVIDATMDQLKDYGQEVQGRVQNYLDEAAESMDVVFDLAASGDPEALNVFRDIEEGATIRLQNSLEFVADDVRKRITQIAMSTLRGGLAVVAAA